MRLAFTVTGLAVGIVLALFWFMPYAHAGERVCGRASWYSYTGHRTANGERFNGSGLTAASRTLPFGTVLIVQNVQNGRSVRVRINDRGPYVHGRFLDLSRAAADAIGLVHAGVGTVCAERLP